MYCLLTPSFHTLRYNIAFHCIRYCILWVIRFASSSQAFRKMQEPAFAFPVLNELFVLPILCPRIIGGTRNSESIALSHFAYHSNFASNTSSTIVDLLLLIFLPHVQL